MTPKQIRRLIRELREDGAIEVEVLPDGGIRAKFAPPPAVVREYVPQPYPVYPTYPVWPYYTRPVPYWWNTTSDGVRLDDGSVEVTWTSNDLKQLGTYNTSVSYTG